MSKKKVLIIEDRKKQRLALHSLLAKRGFEVYSAGLVAEARELAEKHWSELDVAVLDMRMDEDPDHQGKTGADIADEVRRAKQQDYPPEFLIYSAYTEIDYYKLALKLGVAAYLSKEGESDKPSRNLIEAVRHVRILALRRALNSDNPDTLDRVARIATQSHTEGEAIVKFCQSVLGPEFVSCLGAPFVILFSEENKMTQNCADSAGLSQGSSQFYHTLQALTHGKGNLTEPYILDLGKLGHLIDAKDKKAYAKMDGAAFVPIPISQKYKLSIGILQDEESPETPVPEDARALCIILAQYLRPTVLENMLKIWPRWTELKAIRSSVAKLCLFVGQELKYLLPGKGEDDRTWSDDSLARLWDLAGDLDNTGQLLRDLESRRWEENSEPVSIKGIAEMSWGLITKTEEGTGESLQVEGDCTVQADRRDLMIAISRVLHWLAQRRDSTPAGIEPLVSVRCRDDGGTPTIIFEDKSQRLNKKLRDEMFVPFAQGVPVPFAPEAKTEQPEEDEDKPEGRYLPLYLAKMLVEGRYHGSLKDHSDDEDIKDLKYGHRVVMEFPPDVKDQ
ncbi:MAG TPA: response regulator [Blastocatellia bacterium]|jgi:CheY-like chemotaxis protein|nr:response regulator [Blastocatellia bacterium]